jgi:hypothetical protein
MTDYKFTSVQDLIEILQKANPRAEVYLESPNGAYLANKVIIAGESVHQKIYIGED